MASLRTGAQPPRSHLVPCPTQGLPCLLFWAGGRSQPGLDSASVPRLAGEGLAHVHKVAEKQNVGHSPVSHMERPVLTSVL